jgi:hypothetical protein
LNALAALFVVFSLTFGSAMLGQYLRRQLPAHHFSEETVATVRLTTGLIATMAALVLGLLITSAKGTFDGMKRSVAQNAARIERLDRTLAEYGPETHKLRAELRDDYALYVDLLSSRDADQLAKLSGRRAIRRLDDFLLHVSDLKPGDAAQEKFKEEAVKIADEVASAYWLILLQRERSIAPLIADPGRMADHNLRILWPIFAAKRDSHHCICVELSVNGGGDISDT